MRKIMLLAPLLAGCSSPCHLSLAYGGDLIRPIYVYNFQPGVTCVY
ncbi:hypothetical protein [Methylomicrobium sp. Wu6]|nr:hypothetical protein [Methylomicrobium sp. Wu6]MEC4750010.1 hypothetical protein [Methylomicrobium sp. Wu6]